MWPMSNIDHDNLQYGMLENSLVLLFLIYLSGREDESSRKVECLRKIQPGQCRKNYSTHILQIISSSFVLIQTISFCIDDLTSTVES